MKDLFRLLALFRPHWAWMVLAIALSLASILANIGLMATSGWFVAAMGLAGVAGVSMNYFTPAAFIRIFAIIRTGGRYAERVVSHEAAFRILAGLRTWFYTHIEPLAPAGLQQIHSGDLLARIRTDIDRLELFFLRLFVPVIVALLASAVIIAIISCYLALAAIVQFLLLGVAGIVLPVYAARAGRGPSTRLARDTARLNVQLVDTLEGLAELQAYGLDAGHTARIAAATDELIADESELARLSGLSQAGTGLAANLALWSVLIVAIPAVTARAMMPADLAMLGLLALASFEAIAPVPLAVQSLAGTMVSARRLFALAGTKPVTAEPEHPVEMPPLSELVFHNAGLHYPGASRPALSNITLKLTPGRHIGVLGPSGSGKSSLINLALRFWEPNQGEITLGGVPLKRLSGDKLRQRISVVSQNAHLFTASVAENLRVAAPKAGDSELKEACEIAQIHDFIVAQPAGYRTLVGASGLKLSGGQARRLAVARALLKRAPILLLDEPAEGLDVETERALLGAVLENRAECAILYITHRPTALEMMDEILILEDGCIIDRGSTSEVLGKGRALMGGVSGAL